MLQVFLDGLNSNGTAAEDAPSSKQSATGELETPGWQRLLQLAQGCALVVMEDMPIPHNRRWLQALRTALPGQTQLWAVDTASVMPMLAVERKYEVCAAYRCVCRHCAHGAQRFCALLQRRV